MRVLGIDPGTRIVGYGVVEPQGFKIVPIAFGVIKAGRERGLCRPASTDP